MWQKLKSKFQIYSRQVTRKIVNFVNTGEFNLPLPEVALSYVDAKMCEINQTNVAEKIKVDEVEVIFNPENTDLSCLQRCLEHMGIPEEEFKKFELSVGYFTYLKYTPSGLLRFMGEDFPYGVAYLAPRASGENRYIILKPETKLGTLLLCHEHFIIVKGVPQAYRQFRPTLMAKIINFLFGFFIPQLGFGMTEKHQIYFDDEDFEDEDDFSNFVYSSGLKALRMVADVVGQEYEDRLSYFFNHHEIILEDYYAKKKRNKEAERLKNLQLIPVTNGRYTEFQEKINNMDNFGFLKDHFEKVKQLKEQRPYLYGLDDRTPFRYFKGEKVPKFQAPRGIRKSHYNKQKIIEISHGKEEIFVDDILEETEFYYPNCEDFSVIHVEESLYFENRPFYFTQDKFLKFKNDTNFKPCSYTNYYTDIKYKVSNKHNVLLNQYLLDQLLDLKYQEKIRINGLTLRFKSKLAKESLLKYVLNESEGGSNLNMKINLKFAYRIVEEMYNNESSVINERRNFLKFVKKDVFGFFKKINLLTMEIDKVNKYCFIVDRQDILNFEGYLMTHKGLTLLAHKPRFLQICVFLGVKLKVISDVVLFPSCNIPVKLVNISKDHIFDIPKNMTVGEEKNWKFNYFKRWSEINKYTNEEQFFTQNKYFGSAHWYDDLNYLQMQKKNFNERFEIEHAHLFALVVGNFMW